ncbi:MAG: BadF/BadG/BcrA/BcrD ATPase family protein [Anaerolineae bacterium]|nr:hypothetical protein [Thermoflexales bacterium]MDW8408726.1 BadF/BadG/BcrA/BcrD ATPase family protein [Anaerolineae bacterium]
MNHSTQRYVLGLDGGGSKTECVLVREDGLICGRGRGGGVNRNFVSDLELERSVSDALNGALKGQAHVRRIESIIGSMSCDSAALQAFAAQYQVDPARIEWVGEALPARVMSEVVYGQAPEVVIVAGTGSLAAGWLPDGGQRTVGGAGSTIGDEGSAYWIGLRALRRLVHAFDGREPFDSFAESLCETLAIPNLSVLINRVYGGGKRPMSRDEIAGIAVAVCRLAEAGDPFAHALFEEAAHELAMQINTLIRLLGVQGAPVRILPYGGVFRSGALILEPLKRAVCEYAPQAQFLPPLRCTVIGSAAMALRAIGVDPTQQETRDHLVNGAREYDLIYWTLADSHEANGPPG